MKSLLLAICIAALATPANARPWAAFYCGKDQIAWLPSKYFDHYFDMKKDPDQKRPLSNRLFRTSADGDLFYKGKKCRDFTEKDYDALE
jgi:hypothetical protein